jgi:phosphoesterase RecJ-like protein
MLEGLGKKTSVVISDPIPSSLSFLPNISDIKKTVEGSNDLVLKVNIENIDIEKIATNTDGKTLDIVLTPQGGKLEVGDVKVESCKPAYDAIIVLDTPDVDKIDKIYDDFTELFFETPVVNIDHHAGNEYFGTVNLVDLTATSTAEILVSIFEALGKSKPDEDTATLLLAGITADTASFKNTNTTPKTLTVAAQLLAAGAHQQEIIQNFYKMKTLKTLKLWGKILSNAKKDTEHRIVWSKVNYDDFLLSGVTIEGAKEVMDEMLANTPNADVVALLVEVEKNRITVLLKGIKGTDVLRIAEVFGGSGQALAATFEMKNVPLADAEEKVLSEIKKNRAKNLGRPVTEEIEKKRVEVSINDEKEAPAVKGVPEAEEVAIEPQKPNESETTTSPETDELPTGQDVISKAIESLEAAGETIETEEQPKEKEIKKDPNSLTPVSEILKKFNPSDKQKLEEFNKKNEITRENLKNQRENQN